MEDLPKDATALNKDAGFSPDASTGLGVDSPQADNTAGGGQPTTVASSDFTHLSPFDEQPLLASMQHACALPYPSLGANKELQTQESAESYRDGYYHFNLWHKHSGKALDSNYDEEKGTHRLSIEDVNSNPSQCWVFDAPHKYSPLVKIWHNMRGILTYNTNSQALQLENDKPYDDPTAMWRVVWDTPGECCRLVHNASGLALDCNGKQLYMHQRNDGVYQLWNCHNYNGGAQDIFSRPLQGGALIIGSLLWQDDRTGERDGRGREFWRKYFLAPASHRKKVFAPIRYGRYSQAPKKYRYSSADWEDISQRAWQLEYQSEPVNPAEVDSYQNKFEWKNPPKKQEKIRNSDKSGAYTMVLSHDADKQHTPENVQAACLAHRAGSNETILGQAWVWPFQEPVRHLRGLVHQVLGLSQAEGMSERITVTGPFLGDKDIRGQYAPNLALSHHKQLLNALIAEWGMVTLLINPRCPTKDRESLISIWRGTLMSYQYWKEREKYPNWYTERFSAEGEKSCVGQDGQLDLQPLYTVEEGLPLFDVMPELDFILATVTVPKPATKDKNKDKKHPYPSAKEVASHILNDTRKYFQTNCEHDIRTAHDEAIWAEVRRLYQQQEPCPDRDLPLNPPYPPTPDPDPYYPPQDL